jgi:hypothetical protein
MGVHPKKYDKEEFLKYLKRNKVSTEIISKFAELPESVERTGTTFKLDVNTTWYTDGNTHYTFELNYYSDDVVEYLFNLKVFNDVEVSINYLLCELINNNHIKTEKDCRQ